MKKYLCLTAAAVLLAWTTGCGDPQEVTPRELVYPEAGDPAIGPETDRTQNFTPTPQGTTGEDSPR